ncbi:MAG TPA: ABC transporter ATP-binding protein [Ramlibacter sp.]|nr:ABC transporter ATP-binding protein [Ramlibacter sp.]
MNAPLLQVTNLHAGYGRVEVLFGIDFSVTEGGITAILGANGAGKTTTLRAISALIRANGNILFQGERIDGKSTEAIAARKIAHVPDGRGTLARLSVEENLSVGGYTLQRSELNASFERVFRYFPKLKDRQGQQAGTLSGGEQQMLAIGRALMLQPRLLLMDEPSFGLAPRVVDELFDIMRSINREQRVSILLVEQNAQQALAVADHAFLLETGRVVISGPADALLKDEAVRRSYLGY